MGITISLYWVGIFLDRSKLQDQVYAIALLTLTIN